MIREEAPGGALGRAKQRAGELGVGMYSFLLCLAALGIVGAIGVAVDKPLLFPSLGPTVMLFFETPEQETASARNAVVGHLVAMAVGLGCLYGLGLGHALPATQTGLRATRVVAAALSVAGTAVVLRALRSPHPPAGATTLIISLGVFKTANQLASMAAAVVLVTVTGVALNRLFGVDHQLAPAGD